MKLFIMRIQIDYKSSIIKKKFGYFLMIKKLSTIDKKIKYCLILADWVFYKILYLKIKNLVIKNPALLAGFKVEYW